VGKSLESADIIMKNSPTTAVLLGILCFSVLGSVILCYLNIKCSRELRQLQA